MRAEDLPQPFVTALGEQVQIDLAQGGQESVRVGRGVRERLAVGPRIAHFEAVVDEIGERQ